VLPERKWVAPVLAVVVITSIGLTFGRFVLNGALRGELFNVLAMGLNPSPSGETFRFFDLLEFGDGEVPNEFAQPL
jgi:hypothetical protein